MDENMLPIAVTVITLSSLIPNIVGKNIFLNLKFLKFDFVKWLKSLFSCRE